MLIQVAEIIRKARAEALRVAASAVVAAAVSVLVTSCAGLPGLDLLVGGSVGGPTDTGAGATADDLARQAERLERVAAKLDLVPSAVHDQVVAERDASAEQAVALGLEVRVLEQALEDRQALIEQEISAHNETIDAHNLAVARAQAAEGRADAAEAQLEAIRAAMAGMTGNPAATAGEGDS